jgi:hypothetical protein
MDRKNLLLAGLFFLLMVTMSQFYGCKGVSVGYPTAFAQKSVSYDGWDINHSLGKSIITNISIVLVLSALMYLLSTRNIRIFNSILKGTLFTWVYNGIITICYGIGQPMSGVILSLPLMILSFLNSTHYTFSPITFYLAVIVEIALFSYFAYAFSKNPINDEQPDKSKKHKIIAIIILLVIAIISFILFSQAISFWANVH